MKLLLLVASYPPVLESAGRLYSQLAESLVQAGHHVTVITEHPAAHLPMDRNHSYFREAAAQREENGVRVCRVSPLSALARVPGGKASRFLVSCFLYVLQGVGLRRQDVILVYSPPLFMGMAGFLLSVWHRAPFVLNIQDLHPKVLFDSGVIRNPCLKRLMIGMEWLNYRTARSFIVYSKGNRDYLIHRRVTAPIEVIPNWVDVASLGTTGGAIRFREEEKIANRFMVSYAGIMQPAQGLEIVLNAAEILRAEHDIIFFVAGEGGFKAELVRLAAERRLDNVLIRPAMPSARYLDCLHASDVCLITLGTTTPVETVPGKLAYLMACGKPVVAAVNLKGDAARVIDESGGGRCVPPGDAPALATAILALRDNPAPRREMARCASEYARRNFSRESCTRRYETALQAAVAV